MTQSVYIRKIGTFAVRSALILTSVFATVFGVEAFFRVKYRAGWMQDFQEAEPEQGMRFFPNARSWVYVDGQVVPVRTNNVRLRQDWDVPATKSPDEKRILFVGDSYMFGWGVDLPETFFFQFSENIKRQFPSRKIVSLNGGHGGFGTAQVMSFLKNNGWKLEPDAVVYVSGPQDYEDDTRSLPFYVADKFGAFSRNSALSTIHPNRSRLAQVFPAWDWLLYHSILVQMIRPGVVRAYHRAIRNAQGPVDVSKVPVRDTAESRDETLEFTRSVYLYMKKMCDDRGVPFLVMTPGTGTEATKASWRKNAKWFRNHKIDFVDTTPELEPRIHQTPRPLFLSDAHFNTEGYALYTSVAWPHLSRWLHKNFK